MYEVLKPIMKCENQKMSR